MADLDLDGHLDIVSVHESDTTYDGVADGHIRIAFGSGDPDHWVNVTLAEGPEAGAAEDAAIADVQGDGYPDIIAGSYSRGPRDRDGDLTPEDSLGRLGWFEQPDEPEEEWTRHDISHRKRGMFDKFVALDMHGDGDTDFVSTRGNSDPYDGH